MPKKAYLAEHLSDRRSGRVRPTQPLPFWKHFQWCSYGLGNSNYTESRYFSGKTYH